MAFKFNIFKLGNAVILYYLLIFYLVPFLALFGVSTKFVFSSNSQIPWQTLIYITLGLLMFVIGYFNPLGKYFAKKTPNIFKEAWNLKRAKIVFWVVFTIGTATRFIRVISGAYNHKLNPLFANSSFYSVIGYLDWFWYIALAIAFIVYYDLKKRNDNSYRLWQLLAFGTLGMQIFYGIPTCSRASIIIPVLIYLLIKSHFSKIRYLEIILISFIIVFFAFPLGNICRNPLILNAYEVMKTPTAIDTSNAKIFLVNSFLTRINQSFIISKVLESPPELVSSYGSSLSNFIVTLGPPKFIWKDKPPSTNILGNEFGRRLEILSPEDFKTSIGPTVIGDLYINFGILGIILGMFLMGIFFRFIYDYLIKSTNISSSGLMIYSIFFIQIMHGMENWIAPVWAGLIKLLVILIVIHYFLTLRKFL